MNQGRALERITDEQDYPIKIKTLVEELRCSKERNRVLEQKLRQESQTSKMYQDLNLKLEDSLREARG